MAVECPSCRAPVDAEARFCSRCGRTLAVAVAAERRAVVTILFCDLVESTKLGERVDPELLRELQAQYFSVCSLALHRHGGQIEKYIGDAVLCVFGLAQVREDDALRACRAALDLLDGIRELNERLVAEWSVRLDVRIGINTGEVVAGDLGRDQVLATGDAVNVAARLEQAAGPGEVLLGAETHRRVAGRVEAEAAQPIVAKGKAEPLRAYRLRALLDGAPSPHAGGLFVGRATELAALQDALAEVTASRMSRGVLLLGEPGVGKSRLVAELARTVDASLVRGSCLPYGEGITFWPLAEIVDQLDGRVEVPAELLRALGRRAGAVSREETVAAVARLFDALAGGRGAVVVLEDLHWAEPLLLELVDLLPAALGSSPVLLVGTARPELTLRGAPRALRPLRLEPLGAEDAAALVQAHGLDEAQRALVVGAAGGNPLFLEQLCAAGVTGDVPPDVRALLDARLDALGREEREIVEAASVVGRDFWIEALRAVLPERAGADVLVALRMLERLELVEETGAGRGGPPTGLSTVFRSSSRWSFRHALVQDAAYRSLTKSRRSNMHARFASYLDETAGEVNGLDAVVGWHLEQAARLRAELRPADADALAARASARLEDAGRQALERDDPRAAARLLGRAASLVGDGARDVETVEPSLPVGARIADYVVEAVAGRGGMGVVYRARDERLGRAVALKVISPGFARDAAFRSRFKRESLIAAQIEHPNVVPVYRAGEDGDRLYIAMRYVDGTDLASLIEREGRLDPETSAAIVDQVAHALEAAHARGLVHRDVKPGNVLLTRDGAVWRAFLTDFGLSVQGGGEGSLTRTGQWVGTLAYVAPEQVRGGAVDGRTDVYALGGVLHHCLTGDVPYPRAHELDALSAHLAEPPPRPSAVDAGLDAFDDVVAKAMQKDPARRYAAAGELGRAAVAAVHGVHRGTMTRIALRRMRRVGGRRAGVAAVVLAVVAIATGLALALRDRSPSAARSPTRLHVPLEPDHVAVLGKRVWAVASDGGRLARLDPATGRAGSFPSPVDLGGGDYPGLETGFGSLWLAHANPTVGGVDRIDPVSVQALQHIPLPGTTAVEVGRAAVWATGHRRAGAAAFVLAKIDPRRNRIVRSVPVGPQPAAIAEGAGAVWVADARSDSVYRVDLGAQRVVAKIAVGAGPAKITAGANVVWVANLDDQTLSRIDPATNRVIGAPVSLGKDIDDIRLDGRTLWVASADATVVGLSAADGSVVAPSVSTDPAPLALATGRGAVWVASAADSTIQEISSS